VVVGITKRTVTTIRAAVIAEKMNKMKRKNDIP